MTIEEAIRVLEKEKRFLFHGSPSDKFYKPAFDMAIVALLKMETIQEVIDMPFEWEQDDRQRYSKVVDIVRTDLSQEVEE